MRRVRGIESAGWQRSRLFALSVTLLMSLVLAAVPLMGPTSASAGAQTGNGSISIQARICPTDYTGEDYLDDCAPTTDPVEVLITPTGGETGVVDTGADGIATFGSLPDNTYLVELGVPGDFASFYSACFDATTDEFLFDGTSNQITFDTTGGAQYFCRWYVIPEGQGVPTPTPTAAVATGEIGEQVWICPTEYTGTDYLTDCAPTEDPIAVYLWENDEVILEGATGDDGYVAFSELLDGDYTVTLDVPGDFANFYFACFDAATDEFLFDGDTNFMDVSITDGASVFCRWYVIPEDLSGQSPSPSASPSATARPSGIAVLPSTGAGTSAGGTSDSLQIALAGVVALLAAASVFGLRRLVPRRRA